MVPNGQVWLSLNGYRNGESTLVKKYALILDSTVTSLGPKLAGSNVCVLLSGSAVTVSLKSGQFTGSSVTDDSLQNGYFVTMMKI